MGLGMVRAPLEGGFGITYQSTRDMDGGIPPQAGRVEAPASDFVGRGIGTNEMWGPEEGRADAW